MHGEADSDQDDFLDKRKKITQALDLYLQMHDEEIVEIVKGY